MDVKVTINGSERTYRDCAERRLQDLLRCEGLYSMKHGCETGDCGTCVVLVDDRPVVSCILLAGQTHCKRVDTLERLNIDAKVRSLQRAFVECGAIQCGYCTPAMILVGRALLDKNPAPNEEEVREALAGVLCRCTGYVKPVEAILRVAREEWEKQA